MKFRQEKDSMGQLNVPENALFGATTQRALLNFPISDLRITNLFVCKVFTFVLLVSFIILNLSYYYFLSSNILSY